MRLRFDEWCKLKKNNVHDQVGARFSNIRAKLGLAFFNLQLNPNSYPFFHLIVVFYA
uniref:Uncharacterized protein n=1 Tax=Physcomitrium patens TaxID=3218 RepID=A0A2K1IFH7_PHYPA|nr:hypothetical protein PHYPA_028617 [Physcomitrium patens]